MKQQIWVLLGVLLGIVILGGVLIREAFVSFDYSRMPGVNVPAIVNLATPVNGASATVSSTWPFRPWRFNPGNVLDENVNTIVHSATASVGEWVDIRLGGICTIEYIIIENILGHLRYRLKKLKLEFYKEGQLVKTDEIEVNGVQTFTHILQSPVIADRVKFVKMDNEFLNIADIKIMGRKE
jgi:hypothetical protein